jgi:ABC-2 type transport system ATP-binding protein
MEVVHMIQVSGLTRYYGTHPAVRDVSFRIESNEIVGFLGLNGAGKSTTLKVLAGLLLPNAGTVRINGIDALEAPDSVRGKIGYLPEDPPLYTEMRVRDFLIWIGRIKGRKDSEIQARLPEVLKICQISHVADRVIDTLSHGYRKRVGIAQAIIHEPDLVILDEPISGLDPVQIVEMREVIKALKAHCTVLISSHILGEISQTCDRILVLNDGMLVAQGTEDELSNRMAGSNEIALTVRGSKDTLDQVLSDSSVVLDHVIRAQGDVWHATVNMSQDAREQLVPELLAAGLGLRSLGDTEAELEQIFLGLTAGNQP